jgi:hypothetical protein
LEWEGISSVDLPRQRKLLAALYYAAFVARDYAPLGGFVRLSRIVALALYMSADKMQMRNDWGNNDDGIHEDYASSHDDDTWST